MNIFLTGGQYFSRWNPSTTRIVAAIFVLAAPKFPVSKLTTQIIINNTVKPQFTPAQFTATSTLPKFSEKKKLFGPNESNFLSYYVMRFELVFPASIKRQFWGKE